MTISTNQLVDDGFKTINLISGSKSEPNTTIIDVVSLSKATTDAKVSIANVQYEILGTGNVTLRFVDDVNKSLSLSGKGNYGLKPNEEKIKDTTGDIEVLSDEFVEKFNLVLETHKETGFTE